MLMNVMFSFLGVTADEEYGGLAMGYQAHCTVLEEISRASGMLHYNHLNNALMYINITSRKHWPLVRRPLAAVCQPIVAQRLARTKSKVPARPDLGREDWRARHVRALCRIRRGQHEDERRCC